MPTVTIDEDLHTRVQAVAPDEDINNFVRAAVQDYVARRERLAAQQDAARAEVEAVLKRPRRTPEEYDAEFRRKHSIPGLSHLTHEELSKQAEGTLAALPPERLAEAERLGLI